MNKKSSKLFKERIIEDVLLNNPNFIKYLSCPTLSEQLLSVSLDGLVIQYILNPCDEVKKAAIINNVNAIKYIKEPNIEIQRLVVKMNVENVFDIEYLDEELQFEILRYNPKNIKYIKKPCISIQKFIITNFPLLIGDLHEIDSFLQMNLIVKSPDYINIFKNPCVKVVLYLLDNNLSYLIKKPLNINHLCQDLILEKFPEASIFFKYPNKRAITILLLKNRISISSIRNPSNEDILNYFIGKHI